MNKIEEKANEANDIDVKKLTRCLFMSGYDEKMSPKIILQKSNIKHWDRNSFRPVERS